MKSGSSLLFVVALGLGIAFGSFEFPAYRMFQIDMVKTEGKTDVVSSRLGGMRSAMEGTAITWFDAKALTSSSNASLARRIIVVDVITTAQLDIQELSKISNSRNAAGVLFILPRSGFPKGYEAEEQNWLTAEKALLSLQFLGGAYLAFREDIPLDILQQNTNNKNKDLTISISAKQPSVIDYISTPNLYATLSGAAKDNSRSKNEGNSGLSLPTIAIIANLDTFTAFPGASIGSFSSGSSISVLLELLRVFSRVYHSSNNALPSYNLVFLLASGSPMNYGGISNWIDSLSIDTSIDFALCLESLISNNNFDELYLHVSKPPKDSIVKRFYDSFVTSAKGKGIKLNVIQKKVNVAEPEAVWPHEVISIRRILGATLTSLPTPTQAPLISKTSVLDGKVPSQKSLELITRIVSEAIARIIWPNTIGNSNLTNEVLDNLFEGPLKIDPKYLAEWSTLLSNVPRQFPLMSSSVISSVTKSNKNKNSNNQQQQQQQQQINIITSLHNSMVASGADVSETAWTFGKQSSTVSSKTRKSTNENENEEEEIQIVNFAQQETRPKFYNVPITSTVVTVHRKAPALWDLYVAVVVIGVLLGVHVLINGFSQTKKQIMALFSKSSTKAKKKN